MPGHLSDVISNPQLKDVQSAINTNHCHKNRAVEPTQLKQEVNNKIAKTLATGTEQATRDRPKITARTVRDTNQITTPGLPPYCFRYCGNKFDR